MKMCREQISKRILKYIYGGGLDVAVDFVVVCLFAVVVVVGLLLLLFCCCCCFVVVVFAFCSVFAFA